MCPRIMSSRFMILSIISISILMILFIPSSRDWVVNLFSTGGLENVQDYIDSLGYLGPVFSIFLMTLHSIVFIPSEVILFANVHIYGFGLGLLYTWIGSMLGAYLSFYLARFFGRPLIEKLISKEKLETFNHWFDKNGTFGLFMLRLVPLFSFNLLNYGAGVVSITFWQFSWSTAIGIIPPMVVMAWLFINSFNNTWGLIVLSILAVIIFAFKMYQNKLLNKENSKSNK